MSDFGAVKAERFGPSTSIKEEVVERGQPRIQTTEVVKQEKTVKQEKVVKQEKTSTQRHIEEPDVGIESQSPAARPTDHARDPRPLDRDAPNDELNSDAESIDLHETIIKPVRQSREADGYVGRHSRANPSC